MLMSAEEKIYCTRYCRVNISMVLLYLRGNVFFFWPGRRERNSFLWVNNQIFLRVCSKVEFKERRSKSRQSKVYRKVLNTDGLIPVDVISRSEKYRVRSAKKSIF